MHPFGAYIVNSNILGVCDSPNVYGRHDGGLGISGWWKHHSVAGGDLEEET